MDYENCSTVPFSGGQTPTEIGTAIMSKNTKQSSPKVATLASETLRDPHASAIAKSLAASALSQSSTSKETGKAMETKASQVLQSEKYSGTTKTLAASVLSQSDKLR
jgi:hypothetical protein